MEVPLLSQDEFFRHLNLRSVHATSAKYHYRQALKERLRASSQTQSLTPPKVAKIEAFETKSPILSPVKWLTPKTRKKLFGRPKIRSERRILDFDNNLIASGSEGLLKSLLSNCHVLRHPGVRKEVEAKIQCGTTSTFQLEDEFWEPPSSCIQIRKSYIKKVFETKVKILQNWTFLKNLFRHLFPERNEKIGSGEKFMSYTTDLNPQSKTMKLSAKRNKRSQE